MPNLVNTAFADTDQTGPKNDGATTTVTQNPDFSIAKDATESSVNHAGQVIHYSIVLHNTGNVDLTGVSVTDPFADPGSLQFVSGDTNNNGTLELTETWTYSATHTVTQAEINAGANLVNTAFADTDQTGPKDDDATTTVAQNPDLTIAKDADKASVSQAGQIIHYTIMVTNTGNVDLTGVTISDPFADAIPGAVLFSGDLDNDNSWTRPRPGRTPPSTRSPRPRSTPAATWSTRPRSPPTRRRRSPTTRRRRSWRRS